MLARTFLGGSLAAWRRWLTSSTVSIAALLCLLASVSLAARLPTYGLLPAFPRPASLDYSAEPFRSLSPLSPSYIAEVLGAGVERLFRGLPEAEASALSQEREGAGGDSTPTEPGAPTPGPTSPATSPRPLPTLPPVIPTGWNLSIGMTADRATVRPGESIVYTIVVRNTGSDPFAGNFDIDAHTPLGTTYASNPCPDPGSSDPDDVCVGVDVPVPGTGTSGAHLPHQGVTYSPGSGGRPLGPEDSYVFSYRVTVSPGLSRGTRLENHAHLTVTAPEARPAQTTPTIVVEVVQ